MEPLQLFSASKRQEGRQLCLQAETQIRTVLLLECLFTYQYIHSDIR